MNSYESGETEIPIGLLLAMKNKGYSLDVVLAPSRGDIFNRLMEQLSLSAKTRGVVQQLLEALSRILTQEQRTLDILLKKLGLLRAPTATLDPLFVQNFLAHAGILPDDTLEQDPLPSSLSSETVTLSTHCDKHLAPRYQTGELVGVRLLLEGLFP